MKIIGINMREMHHSIIKTITPGWCPFGDYRAPAPWGRILLRKESDVRTQLNAQSGLPKINVQAIVGMNGGRIDYENLLPSTIGL